MGAETCFLAVMLTLLPTAVADLKTVDELSNGKVDLTYGRYVRVDMFFYIISNGVELVVRWTYLVDRWSGSKSSSRTTLQRRSTHRSCRLSCNVLDEIQTTLAHL